jgi:hypothetical protein
MTAYASLAYAQSLSHVGRPVAVAEWGTAVLLRDIDGAPNRFDAMGPYPLCTLGPAADIPAGLARLRAMGAVSLVMVADPVCGPDASVLSPHFPLCRPFKTHHVIDRRLGPVLPSKHHRDRIRRGARHATTALVSLRDSAWQAHWCSLYAGLIEKRRITGLQAFPAASFEQLAHLPRENLLAFAARAPDGEVLAMQLWIRHGDCAYSHLTATSEAGYRVGATYAVYAAAIDHMADCRVLDLGGGAGHLDDPNESLAAFKRGFANATVMTSLCGAVLDEAAYAALSDGRSDAFFPAYRAPAAALQAA